MVLTWTAKKDHFLDPIELERLFEEIKIRVPQKRVGQHLEIEEIQRLRKLVFKTKDQDWQKTGIYFFFKCTPGSISDLQNL